MHTHLRKEACRLRDVIMYKSKNVKWYISLLIMIQNFFFFAYCEPITNQKEASSMVWWYTHNMQIFFLNNTKRKIT